MNDQPNLTEGAGTRSGLNQQLTQFRFGKLLWFVLICCFLLVASGVVFNSDFLASVFNSEAGAKNSDVTSGQEIRKIPVRVEKAKLENKISQRRQYTGVIRAKQQADLGFELTGRIENIFCDEGDLVQEGQTLAQLDAQTLNARKASTAASLARAIALLDELKAGPRQETIDSMRAQLEKQNSNSKLAELNFQRRKLLFESKAISAEEFDRAFYNFRAAEAQLNSISKQLEELTVGTRPEKIAAQIAAVEQLRAELIETQVQIDKSSIKAPFTGKIVQRLADPGSIASASMPILKLVDTLNLEAVVGVPVKTADSLKVGQNYSISVSGTTCRSELNAKIEQLDLSSRTQNLIFILDRTPNRTIIPGQLCQIEIATKIDAEGFWVPASALTNGIRGLWSLLVVDSETSKTSRVDVQIAYTDGDRALVSGTLESGALVVIEGTHRIVEGQYVEAILDQAVR